MNCSDLCRFKTCYVTCAWKYCLYSDVTHMERKPIQYTLKA